MAKKRIHMRTKARQVLMKSDGPLTVHEINEEISKITYLHGGREIKLSKLLTPRELCQILGKDPFIKKMGQTRRANTSGNGSYLVNTWGLVDAV